MQRRTIARQHFVCGTAAEQTPRRYFYLPYCKRERPRPELSLQHRSVGVQQKKVLDHCPKCFRYVSAVLQAGVSPYQNLFCRVEDWGNEVRTHAVAVNGGSTRSDGDVVASFRLARVSSLLQKHVTHIFPTFQKEKTYNGLKFAPRSSSPVFTCRLLRFNYHISSTCLHVFSKMIIRCCCRFLSLVVFPFLVLKFSVLFRVRSSVFRALPELVLSLPCVSRSFHLFSLFLFPF